MNPLILVFTLVAQTPDVSAADAHRIKAYAKADWPYVYYLSSHAYPGEALAWHRAANFVIASTSSQPIIEYCTPAPVPGINTLFSIDLRLLNWDQKQWCKVLETYPYRRYTDDKNPLVIRLDWLLVQLSDTTVSDARYRLFYNDADITPAEWAKFHKANTDVKVHYGVPEGNSGVSVKKKRWLINTGSNQRTYYYFTLDFLKIDAIRDPLQNPSYPIVGRFQKAVHDGEEHIAGIPKFSMKTGGYGTLQDYLLANGQSARVEEAPGTLVRGNGSFRDYTSITTFGGCVVCHWGGLNGSTSNEYVDFGKPNPATGEYVVRKVKKLEEKLVLDQFLTRSILVDTKRDSALYAEGVMLCTGLKPKDNAANFIACIKQYDQPVSTFQAARELYVTPEEFKLAIAYHDVTTDDLTQARLNSLTKGDAIPRDAWEATYTTAYFAVQRWTKETNK